uniref:L-threonylcarbamoyladenylate synthase n=1 Tax=Roseihalotalea indica TaxID=2867963 RepID=A0AA49JIK6_9BACT|nr:L-threonylcarbamoyladenylate synthase [Tunicatimonas sp. TK19036]
MKAECLKIHPVYPENKKLEKVTEILRQGGVIIYPTDTIYALGCDLLNPQAIERLCHIKGVDPQKNQFSFLCQDISQVSEYVKNLTTPIYKMMKKALPGPYTFILPSSNHVPKKIDTKRKTVGIRVTDHAIPQQLVTRLGHPMITTSVHDEDEIVAYATDPALIYERFADQVDIIIDGGMGNNVASTVIDCTQDEPQILRKGLGDTTLLA